MKLTPLAVSSAPLLTAIAAGGDMSSKALGEASGRQANNIARDLNTLAEAGWIVREPGSRPELTGEGREILAALARANGEAQAEAVAVELPLHLVDPDPELNPRTSFDEEALADFAASIGDKGVLQPILVRPSKEPGRYTVVAGERRRRGAVIAGLFTIPAVIRKLTDVDAFEIATIENVQRANMNPLEEARAFQRIIAARQAADPELKLKAAKEIVAERVKATVRFVELRLQLLTLPEIKQAEVERGVASPKEAIAWQRANKPPAPIKLAPRELLMLAEIACHSFGKGSTPKAARNVRVDGAVRAEPLIETLRAKRLVNQYKDWNSGEDTISVTEPAIVLLGELIVGFARDPHRATAELRSGLLSDDEKSALTGDFHTAWLNAPFQLHPSEIERKRREEEVAAARRAREAEEERARRDRGQEGNAKLARIMEFEAISPGLNEAEFTSTFAEEMAALGFTGPFEIGLRGSGANAEPIVTDANGEGLSGAAAALEALRRLYTIALNRACGFAAMSGPELDAPWSQLEEDEALPFATEARA